MEKKIHLLHTAKVNNNCPECYSISGLEFSFSQEEMENKLYRRASGEVIEILHCNNCRQVIYPVNWTKDIERVYSYNRKLVVPAGSGYQLKRLAFILIAVVILALTTLIYLWNRS